jgi:hypothetical protein
VRQKKKSKMQETYTISEMWWGQNKE